LYNKRIDRGTHSFLVAHDLSLFVILAWKNMILAKGTKSLAALFKTLLNLLH